MGLLSDKDSSNKKSYGDIFDTAKININEKGQVITRLDAFDDDPENYIEVGLSKACAAKNMSDNVAGKWLAACKIK